MIRYLLIPALLFFCPLAAAQASETSDSLIGLKGEIRSIENEMGPDKKFYYRFRIKVESKVDSPFGGKLIQAIIPVREMDLWAADQNKLVGTTVQVELTPENAKELLFRIRKIKVIR